MGRKKKPLPLLEQVTISDAGAEGKAVARVDDLVVFVTGAVPGDVADVQVFRKRRRYLEGRPVKFHHYSDKRTEPVCTHFGTCGGCKWQHMGYDYQLHYKQQQVQDHLQRIGRLDLPAITPIMGAPATEYYRNKLEFSFSNQRWRTAAEMEEPLPADDQNALGFHVPGRFDKILDIQHCHLQAGISNDIRLAVKAYALEHSLSFFDPRAQEGFLRNLLIRNTSTGEWMVIVVFFYEDVEAREGLLEHLADEFPSLTSLMFIVNTNKNDSLFDQEVLLYAGEDHIIEEMARPQGGDPLQFRIGPKSFYQTNSEQAERLYRVAYEFAGLTGNELVFDLYTGTGTIASYVSGSAKKVIGIDNVAPAILDAATNAEHNGIDNAFFIAGDMKDVFTDAFLADNGTPDVIITDPPRAGMHEDVTLCLLNSGAQRIVYVSCNPATQARDLALLAPNYQVDSVQPVDMFPHTHHVENVVRLTLRSQNT